MPWGKTDMQSLRAAWYRLLLCRWQERPRKKVRLSFRLARAAASPVLDVRLIVGREFGELINRMEESENLFRQLLPQLDEEAQAAVQSFLARAPAVSQGSSPLASPFASRKRTAFRNESAESLDGEYFTSARVGSIGSADHVSEDFDRDDRARATGHYNKQSEVAWIQRAEQQLNKSSSTEASVRQDDASKGPQARERRRSSSKEPTRNKSRGKTTDVAYHLDDLDTSVLQEIDEFVLPIRETADALVNVYFTTVHSAFPMLLKPVFIGQYQTYLRTFDPRFSRHWMAQLNVVFAIGAVYSHLVRAPWRADDRDHLVYLARARRLAFNDPTLLDTPPSYERVQVLGLMSFYLTASSQVSRAWIMAGITLRMAQTLGMQLSNRSADMSDVQKEASVRTWWSILTLERLLCIMTGRPSAVAEYDIKTPLPLDVEDEDFPRDGEDLYKSTRPILDRFRSDRPLQKGSSPGRSVGDPANLYPSNKHSAFQMRYAASRSRSSTAIPTLRTPSNASYFIYRVELSNVTHQILVKLFSANALDQSWGDVAKHIMNTDKELQGWLRSLPVAFDFTKPQDSSVFDHHRLALSFFYYSSKMLLTRPCLCRLDQRIANESAGSKQFNRSMAAACIFAARKVIEHLPDKPDSPRFYLIVPWWSFLHHIMQATTNLVSELALRAVHVPDQAEELLDDAKKGVRWLWAMAQDDLAARRAWTVMLPLVRKAAAKIGGDTLDLTSREPPHNPSGSHRDPATFGHSPEQFAETLSMEAEPLSSDHVFQMSQSMYPQASGVFDSDFSAQQWSGYDEFNPYHPWEERFTHQPNPVSEMFPSVSEMQAMRREHDEEQRRQQESNTQTRGGGDGDGHMDVS
ncbi:MAG: hypothetical protein M1814_006689 [Vezdaea aestivalis]|nr:MAG: hypothetical protein M1814_006689 [Vezdaea aestivalis]